MASHAVLGSVSPSQIKSLGRKSGRKSKRSSKRK